MPTEIKGEGTSNSHITNVANFASISEESTEESKNDKTEEKPSLWERIKNFFKTLWKWFRRILIGILIVAAVDFLAWLLSYPQRKENISLSAAEAVAENVRVPISEDDMELARTLRSIAGSMLPDNGPAITLSGSAAQEFGRGFFRQGMGVTVTQIIFHPDQNRAELSYQVQGDSVTMSADNVNIVKNLSMSGGIQRGGTLFQLVKWYLWDWWHTGNVHYTCNYSVETGSSTIRKQSEVRTPFNRVIQIIRSLPRMFKMLMEGA